MGKRMSNHLWVALIGLVLLLNIEAVSSYQFRHQGGRVVKWQTLPVDLVVDNGSTDILADVQSAAKAWNDIPTAQDVLGTVTRATDADGSALEFTAANFGSAWGKAKDDIHEVVFDEDGSVLRLLGQEPLNVNGLARTRSTGGVITDVDYVLNGMRTNFDRRSTLVHEFGHIQGLMHSSVGMHNSISQPSAALDRIPIGSVPTMHPYSNGTGQNRRTPEQDDISGLSELYPQSNFATSFGTITGRVTQCFTTPPKPLLGVNVRAVNVNNPSIQISRYTGFDGNAEGRYRMSVPPGTYRLLIEAMGANGFTAKKMRIITRIDTGFSTEYYNPPQEGSCTDAPADEPVGVTVASGASATVDFKVNAVTLAMIVDDTGSMGDEIDGIRKVLKGKIDRLERLRDRSFPTTAIVTHKDDVTLRIVSNDPDRLRQVVDSLSASGGGDCEESSLAAALTAGRLLSKGGVAMLFTDAPSRADGPTTGAVTSFYRARGLRLSTLLSVGCGFDVSSLPNSTGETMKAEGQQDEQLKQASVALQAGPSVAELEEFPPEPVLGYVSPVESFVEIAAETDGSFAVIPEVDDGTPEGETRYVNTGLNIALSAVVPSVSLVRPHKAPQGATLDVEIRGALTSFQDSSEVAFGGDGITVHNVVVKSPTQIAANITIATSAALGFRDVIVTTGLGGGVEEESVGIGSFQVAGPSLVPTIVSVSPSSGVPGEILDITIQGAGTNFVNGVSSADFGSSITVDTITVSTPTTASVTITIAEDAVLGFRDVNVRTGSETASEDITGPFLVTAEPPAIPRVVRAEPNDIMQGMTLDLVITGENTSFLESVSEVTFSGSGIRVNSVMVRSPDTIEVNVTVDEDAELGFRDLNVVTSEEVATLLNALNVRNVNGGPVVHRVDCSSGTIAAAMSEAQPGDTIMITGTCNETVVVDKDGITLDGGGTATIDGMDIDASVILVKGQQNVTIKGLTVQNGLFGIHVSLGASAWLENVTAKDSRYDAGHNSGIGILVANSSDAVLAGTTVVTGNASHGIVAWQGGRASVVGEIAFEGSRIPLASLQANGNSGDGIHVGIGSSLQVHGVGDGYSTVQANDNDGDGIHLEHGSSAHFGGAADIEATGNGGGGLLVADGSSAAFVGWGDRGFTGTFSDNGWIGIYVVNNASLNVWDGGAVGNITATNNVADVFALGWGLMVDRGSSAFFGSYGSGTTSKLVLQDNDYGAGVYGNSSLVFRLPTEIKDNAVHGIEAWGNSWVESANTESVSMITGNGGNGIDAWNGVGVYLRNAIVVGNLGFDVSAGKGSRLDWYGSLVGTVYCDSSTLAFNDAVCPEGS